MAALGVAGFAFLLYLGTLAPSVLYYERPELIDAAMLQVHSYALGITHPTGYPTWTMLAHIFTYLPFGDPAYRANLARLGFTDEDLVPGGSDRLIDAVTAWGDVDDVARRIQEHLDAGADHVALHVLNSDPEDVSGKRPALPRRQWRELAALLPDLARR